MRQADSSFFSEFDSVFLSFLITSMLTGQEPVLYLLDKAEMLKDNDLRSDSIARHVIGEL